MWGHWIRFFFQIGSFIDFFQNCVRSIYIIRQGTKQHLTRSPLEEKTNDKFKQTIFQSSSFSSRTPSPSSSLSSSFSMPSPSSSSSPSRIPSPSSSLSSWKKNVYLVVLTFQRGSTQKWKCHQFRRHSIVVNYCVV